MRNAACRVVRPDHQKEQVVVPFFNIPAWRVLENVRGLVLSSWCSWWTLWRYASDHGLLAKDHGRLRVHLESAANKAWYRQPVTYRELQEAYTVVVHAVESYLGRPARRD
jgi:hypothetical protein